MLEKIKEFLALLKSSKALNLVVLLAIVAAIPLTVFIAQKQQETRQRASASTTLCFTQNTDNNCLTDASKPLLKVGDTITLDVLMKPGTNQIIATTLDISFDPTKIATTGPGLVRLSNAFPSLIQGPIYTAGNILVTMSVGIDLTKVIKTDTKIASITFKTLGLTDTIGTKVYFTNQTNVTSTINDPETNVLSTAIPATLLITDIEPSIAPPVYGGPFKVTLSNNNTSMTCIKGDPNCYYQSNVNAINNINKPLYKTTIYADNKIVSFVGFDTQWTSSKSQTDRVLQPGDGITTLLKVIPPSFIGDYFATLYIDAQTCNNIVTPPDCIFYGATQINIKIKVIDSKSTPSPSPAPFVCGACAADIKKDIRNRVDSLDYAILASCFRKSLDYKLSDGTSCSVADINRDGLINELDYQCLQSQYFKSCISASSATPTPFIFPTTPSVSSIPLPTKVLLK